MEETSNQIILRATGARAVQRIETIQNLWSGYGQIYRAHLIGGELASVIVKHVHPPALQTHPRGWNSKLAWQRKLKSYEVEAHWYQHWSQRCAARVPACHLTKQLAPQSWLILEDLDDSGFRLRHSTLDRKGCEICLEWLAAMHAGFIGCDHDKLWDTGTYWHLRTRPQEYAAMPAGPLKRSATAVDSILSACRYQTILHGDAKVANFCFHANKPEVAAVDFQYTGRGCGVKDVAYFLGSCMDNNALETQAAALLDHYFVALRSHLAGGPHDADALEREWRDLYPLAWTDFYRFMAGWMPGHRKINQYTRQMAEVTFNRTDIKARR